MSYQSSTFSGTRALCILYICSIKRGTERRSAEEKRKSSKQDLMVHSLVNPNRLEAQMREQWRPGQRPRLQKRDDCWRFSVIAFSTSVYQVLVVVGLPQIKETLKTQTRLSLPSFTPSWSADLNPKFQGYSCVSHGWLNFGTIRVIVSHETFNRWSREHSDPSVTVKLKISIQRTSENKRKIQTV